VTAVPFGGLRLATEPGRVMVPRATSLGLVALQLRGKIVTPLSASAAISSAA